MTDCSWSEPKLFYIPFEWIDTEVHTLNVSGNTQHEIKYPFPSGIQPRILDVSNNFIVNVKNTSFTGLHDLEYIDLSHNFMTTIDPYAFK